MAVRGFSAQDSAAETPSGAHRVALRPGDYWFAPPQGGGVGHLPLKGRIVGDEF
jgi:hypothetical protein